MFLLCLSKQAQKQLALCLGSSLYEFEYAVHGVNMLREKQSILLPLTFFPIMYKDARTASLRSSLFLSC
jgi:hypothetical protein